MLRNTKMEPFMVLRVSVNSGAGRNPDSSFLWSTTRVTSFVPVSDFYRGIRAVLTPWHCVRSQGNPQIFYNKQLQGLRIILASPANGLRSWSSSCFGF
ncbi:hypothetical protein HID58_060662 [Brassica napus]|uniref:Uncharacterized protein n=1 Tax=Brassica napus TaxID=3708 RepID=A0ABQ7ZWB4_BRANA|nr:hypothetical protein HID58_060662 [Brassica napus]